MTTCNAFAFYERLHGGPGCEVELVEGGHFHFGDHRIGRVKWMNPSCPIQKAADVRAMTGNYAGYRSVQTLSDLAQILVLHPDFLALIGRRLAGEARAEALYEKLRQPETDPDYHRDLLEDRR